LLCFHEIIKNPVRMDDGWGDDEEFLSDEFEDIINNETCGNERSPQVDEQLYDTPYSRSNVANGLKEDSSTTIPMTNGWGEDDILLVDDEEEVDDTSPALQQLQHHILPLSMPLTLTPSTHIETCPFVNLEQALIEEEANTGQDNAWSFDESVAETSSWIPDEEVEEKACFDRGTQSIAVESESPTQEDREHKLEHDGAQLKNDDNGDQDGVLQQLQNHVPPLSIPIQQVRKCSVDVELELALEEDEKNLGLLGGGQILEQPAVSTVEFHPQPNANATTLDVDPIFPTAVIGGSNENQESSWGLDINLEVDDKSEDKTLLRDLDSVDINSTAPTSGTLGEPIPYDQIDGDSQSPEIQAANAENHFSSSRADLTVNRNHEHPETSEDKNIISQLDDSLVDYSKLLEVEMTKNILLKKQNKTLNHTIEELLSLQENTEKLAQQRESEAMTNSCELKAKIIELEQSLFVLKERKREDEKKIERLQADFNTSRQELEQLQGTFLNMEYAFQNEKKQQKEVNLNLQSKLDRDKNEITGLKRKIGDLTQENATLHDRCLLLERENGDVLQLLQAEQQNLAFEQGNVSHLTNSLSEARKHEQMYMELLERYENLQQEHQARVDSLSIRSLLLEQQVESLKEKAKKTTKLEHELLSLRQQHEVEKQEWLHHLQVEQSNAKVGQENVSHLMGQLEEMRRKLESGHQRERIQMEEKMSLVDLEQRHQAQVQQLLGKINDLEKEAELFAEQKLNQQNDLVKTRKELNTTIDEKNSTLNRLSDMEHQLLDAQQNEHSMEQKCISMEQMKVELQEKINVLTIEQSRLKKENSKLNEQLQERERSLNQHTDSIRFFEEQIINKSQEIQSLQYRLEALLVEKGDVASENEELLVQLGLEGQKQQNLELEFQNMSAYFEEQLEAVAQEKKEIEIRTEKVREENERLTEEVKTLSDQVRIQQDRVIELMKDIADQRSKSSNCDVKASDVDILNVALQGRLDDANEKIERLEIICKEQDCKINLLQTALEEFEKGADSKVERGETEVLKQALNDERNKNANLSFDIEKVKADLLEQKKKHQECMIELAHVAESLSNCQDRCNSLEDERNSLLERLSSQKQALAGMQNAKICVDLSEDDAESVEFMREKIIALATALEKSEQSRAESIDRLSIERRKHADSLRKVSENVKRFYSTLTKSHPTMGS